MKHNEQTGPRTRGLHQQSTREFNQHQAVLLEIPNALKQLRKTEPGCLALRDFLRFCREEGLNLSPTDWQALAILCTASGASQRKQ